MKALVIALSLLASSSLLTAGPALSANADKPDQNVDKSNDAGGSTGNEQVDRLNKEQLDENQRPAPAKQEAPPPK